MIGQIGYLGQVSLRNRVFVAFLYTLGVTLGAALVGAALGSAGLAGRWLLGLGYNAGTPGVLLPMAALALVGALRDLGLLSFRLPQPMRQVPQGWLAVFGPHRTGFLWGFHVGLAYTTLIQYSLYYVVAFWVLLAGDPWLGAAVLAVYGLAQGALLVLDVLVVGTIPRRAYGLLGSERRAHFYSMSGAALLAATLLLIRHSGLL
jgi:hypothetical protein